MPYLKKNITVFCTHDKDDVLAFQMKYRLNKGKLLIKVHQKNYIISQEILKQRLFFEFNCFNQAITLNIKSSSSKIICYTHHIILDNSSKSKAFVIDNFFKGSHYIVKANFKGKVIRFNHFKPLKKESEIGFSVTQFSEL